MHGEGCAFATTSFQAIPQYGIRGASMIWNYSGIYSERIGIEQKNQGHIYRDKQDEGDNAFKKKQKVGSGLAQSVFLILQLSCLSCSSLLNLMFLPGAE
jgi:hypothetical protein